MTDKEKLPFWSRPLSMLTLQEPLIIQEDATVRSCIDSMQERDTGCVVVVNDAGKMTGVFTEKDIMAKYINTPLSGDTAIRKVMTADALYRDPDTTVAEAMDFFGEHHIRHLPIVEKDGRIAGLLSVRVLTDFIAEHLPESILNLPPKDGVVSQEAGGA